MDTNTYQRLEAAGHALKAERIEACQHYLNVAESLLLSEQSPTVQYWTQELAEWQGMPIREAAYYALKFDRVDVADRENILEELLNTLF